MPDHVMPDNDVTSVLPSGCMERLPIDVDLSVSALRLAEERSGGRNLREVHVHPRWADYARGIVSAGWPMALVIVRPEWTDEDEWLCVFENVTIWSPGG